MNTFQRTVCQTRLLETIDDLIKSLNKEICHCDGKKEIQELRNISGSLQIKGIAIKLSKLQELSLSVKDILKIGNELDILIDAEFRRLDEWIIKSDLSEIERSRLLFTVQAKRNCASEQLDYFEKNNLKVVLVAGHNSYLTEEERKINKIIKMTNLVQKYSCIKILGCGQTTLNKLEKRLQHKIDRSMILELQGYQSMENSMVWSYYSGSTLTENGKTYLRRRKSKNREKFISRSFEELVKIEHQKYVFIDACNKSDFLRRLVLLNSTIFIDYP